MLRNEYPEGFRADLIIPLGLLLCSVGGGLFMLLGLPVEAFVGALLGLLAICLILLGFTNEGKNNG